jgi:hypothetical protein
MCYFHRGIETVTLAEVYISNTNPEGPSMDKTYTFADQVEKENTHKIDPGSDKAFGVMIGVKEGATIKVPFGEASAELNRKANFSYTWKKIESLEGKEETVLKWEKSGTIVPGKAVDCEAQALSGKFTNAQPARNRTI